MSAKAKLEAWGSRIIVKRDEAPKEKKHGSIIVADNKSAPPNRGVVMSIGPDQKRVQVGWRVMFAPYQAIEIEDGEEKLLVIDEGAIIAIEVAS